MRVGCGHAPQVGDSQELMFRGLPGRPRGQRHFLMLQRRGGTKTGVRALGLIGSQLFTCCVTLGRLLTFSRPVSPSSRVSRLGVS